MGTLGCKRVTLVSKTDSSVNRMATLGNRTAMWD